MATEYTYTNISGNTAVILIDQGTVSKNQEIELFICNTHSADNMIVDLYITREEDEELYNIPEDNTFLGFDIEAGDRQRLRFADDEDDPGTHHGVGRSTSGYDDIAGNDTDPTDPDLTTKTYYILNNVTIPNGATLKLEKDDLRYEYYRYNLTLKLGASGSTADTIVCVHGRYIPRGQEEIQTSENKRYY